SHLDPRASRWDPHRRAAEAGEAGEAGKAARPNAVVLLITRTADTEMAAVANLLRRVGVPVLRLDSDAPDPPDLLIDPAERLIRLGEVHARPVVTWVRHFSTRSLPDSGVSPPSSGKPPPSPGESPPSPGEPPPSPGGYTQWRRESWAALVRQLTTVSATLIPSSGPGLLEQLATATRLGIAVPRTIITTNWAAAAALPDPKVVLKSLGGHFVEAEPGRLTGVFAEVHELSALDHPTSRFGAPVVVQSYVEHDSELRVYLLGDKLVTYEVTKHSPSDPWRRPDRIRARLVSTPEPVRAATQALAATWNLRYAAFDFLITPDGPVFLEANLDGDWRWLERGTSTSEVTLGAARLVRDLYTKEAPVAAGLLTFLAGGGSHHGR
ncbi:hypothetical protein HII36_20885, partial [Nonomuraea sp. NN258]|nr:hypothetical protein [Nonomuraea antri]